MVKAFFTKLTVSHAREHYEDWGKYHCTVDLLFDWFGISCMTSDNICFYLENGLIQTDQTGGQLCSDTSPFRDRLKKSTLSFVWSGFSLVSTELLDKIFLFVFIIPSL